MQPQIRHFVLLAIPTNHVCDDIVQLKQEKSLIKDCALWKCLYVP